MTATPTAYWPTWTLVDTLARAGWGELAGGALQGTRSVLKALVALTDHRSGAGLVTLHHVADTAGLSSIRHVSTRMQLLEALGVITWTRGGVDHGRPLPSHVRISKRALVMLIELARPALDTLRAARRIATQRRIKDLIWCFSKRRAQRSGLSVHAALSDSPPPLKGESPAGVTSPPVHNSPGRTKMLYVNCEHGVLATQCHRCTSLDDPPAGYHYDWSKCSTCGETRELHERIAAKTRPEYRHRLTPTLKRGSTTPPLPGQHLHLVG